MKKMFLVYRGVLDYEDSLTPYLICKNLNDANKACAEILAWYKKYYAQLVEQPEKESFWMDSEEEAAKKQEDFNKKWDEAWAKNDEVRSAAQSDNIYGVNVSDLPSWGSETYSFDESCVSIMELPVWDKNFVDSGAKK